MVKNTKKAALDHLSKNATLSTPKEWAPCIETIASVKKLAKPLQLSTSVAADIGFRKTMQDRSLTASLSDTKTLAAIFDGHRGEAVADYLKNTFVSEFTVSLTNAKDNIHQAFEETIQKLQDQIIAKAIDGGAAAVICLIDSLLGIVYTATVGDSEAIILRVKDGVTLPIFLSPLRNWSTKNERLRAEAVCGKSFSLKNPSATNSKVMRAYVNGKGGLNLSRSIGNRDIITPDAKTLLSIKPEITLYQLHAGDRLLLCSDGIPDTLTIDEIITGLDPKCEKEIQRAEELISLITQYLTPLSFDEKVHDSLTDCLDDGDFTKLDAIIDKQIQNKVITEEQGANLKLKLKEKPKTHSGRDEAQLLVDYASKVKYADDNVTACVIKIS